MQPEPLMRRVLPLPASPAAEAALVRLREAAARQGAEDVLAEVLAARDLPSFLGTALGDCPFLLDLAAKDVRRLAATLAGDPLAIVAGEIERLDGLAAANKAEAMAALRLARQAVALALGLADLGRAIDLEAVTSSLSAFADAALGAALRHALGEAHRKGTWTGATDGSDCGLAILGMGKYGARELNYSSDIDLIVVYDPEAGGLAPGVEPSVFWVRIVRQIVAILQERTADGYVFRVDLRLRPDPGATPVALSIPGALIYYESMGQNWERAALIKARACAGDLGAGKGFLAEIAPFIWRKYLDFAAIADIHSIKRQVHAHRGHGDVAVLGHDIKRGRGGIREIEFFVQTQQLIAGGRDRSLRGIQTRPMLAMLAERSWIGRRTAEVLDQAYVYLRTLEHRLQMVADEQTHTIPSDRAELARIGRLMGEGDAAKFEADVRAVLDRVAARYSELFEDAPALSGARGNLVFTGGDDDPDTLQTLREFGYQHPETVTEAVRAWHFGRFPAMRSTTARERLTELTPALLQALARAGNPDQAFRSFDALLRALPAGAQLFSVLASNPDLLDLLAFILGSAPRLAEIFARRPHVVDTLIDPAVLEDRIDRGDIEARLEATLREAKGFEDALNRARLFTAEQRFLFSVRMLRGHLAPADAGRAFSLLADVIIDALYRRTLEEFRRQHGRIQGGREAILALGRLGSREMTAGSDLDLIVVYDHDPEAGPSDGPRPLVASHYYTRFTQRLVAALSAPTAEGVAYAVDTRLRPSGRAGPLATHLEAFRHYQLNEAWTWEHMALSRARPAAGEAGLRAAVAAVIGEVMARARDRNALAADAAAMRHKVDEARHATSPWELKTVPGGLMDCEFVAQFLVLAGLPKKDGEATADTLRRGTDAGLLDGADGALLARSGILQSALLQTLRIVDDRPFDPEAAPEGVRTLLVRMAEVAMRDAAAHETADPSGKAARPVPATFAELESELRSLQHATREAFGRILG
ncbi:bifunctional [glutamine synthetase] adenylyltransferase/[glutamine synthetase]-adenylyl-L-tyrosine phosphorylase [Propylenella binzhouense]|uniref:Bifunctional glutamine synthetase adenylyltransferase/adenylyl-removing enzyme n=1 Tax=Propylenella binzhouense TaxID=2555902 RepID=A0A964WUI4_9HYPH|nr:bifunctional [glutamine synthetase] adenylyltransferase/[glutamine synthetase]-adenylyl-L-tyrosine phosphorylase [Propylenella binzhouense]MYZ48875.1 bifunctional [glutamine synthetase] adenylyltransferase/[glutamine synthetase]-adenylyl-L-tyrosine phosphorylase [Propylenella binzhouense]